VPDNLTLRAHQELSQMEYSQRVFVTLKDGLAQGKSVTLPVVSESMSPLLRAGDTIIIKGIDSQARLSRFEIAVFVSGDALCCHRVIFRLHNLQGLMYVTKPDKSLDCDEPFSSSDLIGKVAGIKKGKIFLMLEIFPWRQLNQFLGCIHLLLFELKSIFKRCPRKKIAC